MELNLQGRISLLTQLGEYISSNPPEWEDAKEKAYRENGWFIPTFLQLATENIVRHYLQKDILEQWASDYHIPSENSHPKKVGIIMAGNIPLVGFHDLLSVFISGHIAVIKPSSKDDTLIKHLVAWMVGTNKEAEKYIQFADMLKNCDAYVATGSNNSAGYFEYYLKKYPHIIRRNRTSVALLTGKESPDDLSRLADDVFLYFGLGCRNVTKIFVPEEYDFVPLLRAFEKYNYLSEHNKYKNNYDYNLALHILNKKYYMSNPSIILVEDISVFSPVSQLHYQFYTDIDAVTSSLKADNNIQCIAGMNFVPFGKTQQPNIDDYADGEDTLKFLAEL